MEILLDRSPQGIDAVTLGGELDYHASAQLRVEFDKLAENKSSRIVINLGKVSYIDSSVLANFVELNQKIKRYGGKLAFCHLSDKVRQIFELAKFDLFFPLAASEQEAINIVNG